MITEDYVSFEIAKLLKDKGFDVPCYCFYEYKKRLYNDMDEYFPNGMKNSDHDKEGNKGVSAPTHQMVMKWLREKHNFFIQIVVDFSDGAYPMYDVRIVDLARSTSIPVNGYNRYSYKQACEAAIKYCLENLI